MSRGRNLILAVCLLGSSSAWAADPKPRVSVRVEVLVVEASRQGQSFDPRLRHKVAPTLKSAGYKSGKVLDERTTRVRPDEPVRLGILRRTKKPQTLEVTLVKVRKDKTIQLRIQIPESKFKTKTEHKNGGTFAVAIRTEADKAIFLAITPRLGEP